MAETTTPSRSVDIAIVGGGISGLYCALKLARRIKARQPLLIGGAPVRYDGDAPQIHVYETREAFGGRIETWTIDLDPYSPQVSSVDAPYDPGLPEERKQHFFRAEFGPMRIEPRDQPYLRTLLDELGIGAP